MRGIVIALVVAGLAIGGYIFYLEQRDDIDIDLPGDNEVSIDR